MALPPAHAVVETVLRDAYGQLLTYVAARAGGDVAGAEDALGDALLAALQQWPREGIPGKPEAWLLATARRRLIDAQRRTQVRTQAMDRVQDAMAAAQVVVDAGHDFPDERLKLLFVCAHPAIDPAARTPLMLQTVLGLEADRIAQAFLVAPAAMSQRLVRAKSRIRDTGIPFVIPLPAELPERLQSVLEAIYAAYNAGWEDALSSEAGHGLAAEALWLARMVVHLLPEAPEALGLLALLLHLEARQRARLDGAGNYVPLPEQDPALWNRELLAEAESILALAARRRTLERFQLEAAIQSVHAQRARLGTIDWAAITLLYEALTAHSPTLGARIGRAMALAHSRNAETGLAALDELPADALRHHQPYWAARAHLLAQLGRTQQAHGAYALAIDLCNEAPVRKFLIAQQAKLQGTM